MSEIKLLPCPICNGEVKIALFGCGGEEWYSITRFDDEENSCQCRLFMESEKFFAEDNESVKEKHKQDLIKRWNTRKPMERILQILKRRDLEHGANKNLARNRGYYSLIDLHQRYSDECNEIIKIIKEEGGIE